MSSRKVIGGRGLLGKIGMGLVGLVMAHTAAAGPLVNGTFDSADGWVDASLSGAASIVAGVATLATGPSIDPFSAILVQGDDGSFGFADPIQLDPNVLRLEFDVRAEYQGAPDEDDFGFRDTLYVVLYDAVDVTFDRIFSGDAFDFSVSDAWATVALDIASLAGRGVAVSFELADEADLFDTSVFLDNVRLVKSTPPPTTVAEPATLPLIAISGALVLLGFRRKAPDRR